MIDLSCGRCDLPLCRPDQVIVVALRHGGALLGGAGDPKPHAGTQPRRYPLPDEPVKGDGVGEPGEP